MIIIPILSISLIYKSSSKAWDNIVFEFGSERVKEKCIREAVRIGSIIIFHLSKL